MCGGYSTLARNAKTQGSSPGPGVWGGQRLVENVEGGEVAVFEELEGGAATCRHVGDFVGEVHLFDGGGGVAAADDGGGAFARDVGDGLGDGLGAGGEGFLFEDAHGAVPDDGF